MNPDKRSNIFTINGVDAWWDSANDVCRYYNDDEIIDDDPARIRPCPACGESPLVVDGVEIDACFGALLPGVANACCGHGDSKYAYIQLEGEFPRRVIKIKDATDAWIRISELRLGRECNGTETCLRNLRLRGSEAGDPSGCGDPLRP